MISFRERRPWLVGIASILAIAAALAFAFSINRLDALRGVYTLSADLRDAAGLQPGNEVRVAGVKVGRVTGISLTPGAARIEMEISDDVRVPRETRVEVKLKTLLGQKFIDLQMPRGFVASASNGGDPDRATAGYLDDGDVIPRSQTKVPFEIHQAATEGTAVLAEIDKRALRRMIDALATTVGTSKEELRRALGSLNRAGGVLSDRSGEISSLLRHADRATGALAASTGDIEGLLARSAEVLGTLAERRGTISTLLAATNDLAGNLTLLIRSVRGPVDAGVADLDSILTAAEAEISSLEAALEEIGVAQEMFARPLSFGRFVEGHACAVTSADPCVPHGSPEDAGLPIHGTQPEPTGKVAP